MDDCGTKQKRTRRRRALARLTAAIAAIGLLAASGASAARTLYVTGAQAGRVSALGIAGDGSLSTVTGSPFTTQAGPSGTVITPDGKHLYVANSNGNTISAYAVGTDGGLTPVNGSPFGAGVGPHGLAIAPNSRLLYAANTGSDNVSAYVIAGDGALTPIGGSPFPAGDGPLGVAMATNGTHLWVTNQPAGTVSIYGLSADGSLNPAASAQPTAPGPAGIGVTADGQRLYVASSSGGVLTPTGQISGYSIASDGTLAALPGSPYAAGSGASGLAIAPNGKSIYATNDVGAQMHAFTIDTDGSLAARAGSPLASSTHSRGIALTPDGHRLFASGDDGSLLFPAATLSGFAVDDGGAPTPAGPATSSGFTGSIEFGGATTTPNQGPVASFTPDPAKPGLPTTFDARASADADGQIARYDWNFGDGTSLPNGGPTPTHIYPGLDAYTVTLLVTDNEGCSFAVLFTGQTASCNGGPAAVAQRSVDLDPPRITLGGRRIQRLGPTVTVGVSSDEPGRAVGRGKFVVRIPSNQRHHRKAGRVRRLRLHAVSATITAPQTPTQLSFRIPRRMRNLAEAAIENGGKAAANLHISAFDAGGNEDTQLILIQLK